MALNFRISVCLKSGSLHLTLLAEDFDGSSAYELLNVFNDNVHRIPKIIIQTNGLKATQPFGTDVLESRLTNLESRGCEIIFTGQNAKLIAPQEFLGF
jgi:hypothetical protein